ncbi:NAD(P)H-dependent oxidoreductase [Rubellimicrobium roseum]|uniref:Homoserine dehydrogenase n=1 Tax=Rubellimicrobium roseum TaxID=687525 RepID=A0A5C4NHL2_9RHOB|nr:NAD(P)H-dependent oxidoreductase [Rubellimicrobium roseum]TNC72167.1 homoserine dehydrogenase [Rubellimicrobium roseum]
MPTNVALTGLARDLAARAEAGRPVRIGLVGAGEMGTDIVSRVAHMPGVEVGGICVRTPANARQAVAIAYGSEERVREAGTADALNAAVEAGAIAVTSDVEALLGSGLIDVVVDATGVPAAGAEIGLRAMEAGKHLVMMNVEADVTIGAYLATQAQRLGVVYSLGAGDEPSSCMELIEFVTAMGHRVVAAGKGKNNPLNLDATPDAYEAEARRRSMNPRMLVEFVDGSKTMVEMAAIANATGLIPDKPGMHGPAATREELSKVLVPTSAGGVLSDVGRVDYSVGQGVAPGVFVVAEMEHPRIRERMEDLKMGEGPYFTFLRPFHLTSLEVPLSCARAVLYGQADMVPLPRPVAEVTAVAKRDLVPGERLDQIGEYTYRSWIMTAPEAQAARAIPCGLLQGAVVTAPIPKGALITARNAQVPPTSRIASLRAQQDAMLGLTSAWQASSPEPA